MEVVAYVYLWHRQRWYVLLPFFYFIAISLICVFGMCHKLAFYSFAEARNSAVWLCAGLFMPRNSRTLGLFLRLPVFMMNIGNVGMYGDSVIFLIILLVYIILITLLSWFALHVFHWL